jgi:integrase
MSSLRLTKRVVEGTPARDSEYVLWDGDLTGFGLRVRPNGQKTYIAVYRAGHGRAGKLRKVTLGRHGEKFTADQARAKARHVLGAAANGHDPAGDRARLRKEMTVAQLCDLYLEEGVSTKKPTTIGTDCGRIERHIKPLIGGKRLGEVSQADIERFMRDVAAGKTSADIKTGKRGRAIVEGGKGTATRTVGLLGGIFSFAVIRGLRADNPVRGVKRYRDRKGERFLSSKELAALGEALRAAEGSGSSAAAVAIIRLLTFCGARKTEIAALRWSEVDFERSCLRLADSKTGAKVIPLGPPALAVLAAVAPTKGSPYVFPASSGQGHFQGTEKVWRRVREGAGLDDVRLHDLRHSFASIALAGGTALPIIGALLGHADVKTTARYAHLADDPLRNAADRISRSVASALESPGAEVVPLKGSK